MTFTFLNFGEKKETVNLIEETSRKRSEIALYSMTSCSVIHVYVADNIETNIASANPCVQLRFNCSRATTRT